MNPILFPARTEQARLEAMKRHPSSFERNKKMAMTKSTRDMLNETIDGTAADIAEYARQIESGEYGNTWTVRDGDGNEVADNVIADDADSALEIVGEKWNVGDDWEAERNEFDTPTIVDDHGNETSIDEFPLEIVDERGKDFAVVIGTGGPHIEVTASGDGTAHLAGYWSSETVMRHGDQFDTFLDYFIER
ncbi:hypothetical protein [Tsukamurella paurometabola]|uniref:Knr4/Smi1-like domain-containing protein n=1 Tax=Tsukamurella paurometabola TaxID=2061 RepID=A0ABS5NDP9_TSUPA|nr:hypothetical protein [Tsukamurella paurometabola]MBS4102390.1 hypothetical protein [Tsukamurella paurometabola]